MNAPGMIQLFLYLVALLVLVKPLGLYMARVYSGESTPLHRLLALFESWVYRICGIRPEGEMTWKEYATALLLFNAAGALLLFLMQRRQGFLPLNPHGFGAVAPDLAFNTAVSFVTNTNWQAYGGETTMSFLTQMAGLAVQNFVSAASGWPCLRPSSEA